MKVAKVATVVVVTTLTAVARGCWACCLAAVTGTNAVAGGHVAVTSHMNLLQQELLRCAVVSGGA